MGSLNEGETQAPKNLLKIIIIKEKDQCKGEVRLVNLQPQEVKNDDYGQPTKQLL